MTHQQLQDAVLSCTPDNLWKQAVQEKAYQFTEKELMFIAYQQTLTFEKRLEAMDILRENASTRAAAFAGKIADEIRTDWEQFKQTDPGCIFEVEVHTISKNWDEHFICDSFSSAMRMISDYLLGYMFRESEIRGYTIWKRKVFTTNFPAKFILPSSDSGQAVQEEWDEIEIGKCTFAAGRYFGLNKPVLLSVQFNHSRYFLYDRPEFCDGNECDVCKDPCFEGEMAFPKFLQHGDIVQYRCGNEDLAYFDHEDGENHYGIHIEWSPSQKKDETVQEYFIVLLYPEVADDLRIQGPKYFNQFDHLPAPCIQKKLSIEQLPEELQDGCRACLDAYQKYLTGIQSSSNA